MSPKKIFDDIYLHLEDSARKNVNISVEAQRQFRLIENELNEATTMRSILFKTKEQTISMLETSLDNSTFD